MTINFKLQGEQTPREIEAEGFNFEEYKQIMLGEKTDTHGNSLNDVFIGQASFKAYLIEWLQITPEQVAVESAGDAPDAE